MGSSSFSDAGGILNITLSGAGTDIWGKADSGRYAFLPLAGDCEILATVDAIPMEELYGEWARFGLMMRGSLLKNAVNTTFCRVKGTAATDGRLKLTQRPTHDADTANWPGVSDLIVTNLSMSARLRLVRQGDTYTAWLSTNAPAYDAWAVVASHATVFHGAMNVGVFVSRWAQQAGGPDQLTRTFSDVVARNLVAAATNASDGVTVSWIGDPAVTNGTVIGYEVSRAQGPAASFAKLGETAAGVLTYDDATAGLGISYLYRVHAYVDQGAVTNTVLVGTSLPARRPAVFANPSPATLKGVYAEYYKPTSPMTLAAARVDPNINDSWNYSGASVYPPNTPNGLGAIDNFRSVYAGSLTVAESGCYGLVTKVDDTFNLWVDGVQLTAQTWWMNGADIHTVPVWLEAGRSYPIRVEHTEGGGGEYARLSWFKGTSAIDFVPQVNCEPFPLPWQHRDVGDSPRFGNAVYDSAAYSFTVASGGLGIDPATGRDDGHLVWQTCATDFDLMARVTSLTGPAQPGMGAGLTIRSSTADSAAALALVVMAEGEAGADRVLGFEYRATSGGAPDTTSFALPETPVELRLARRGTNLWSYYRTASSGGWVAVTNIPSQLTGTLVAGMTAFSGDLSQTATGVFDTVTFAYSDPVEVSAAVSSLDVDLTLTKENPMALRQASDALANVAYYWADAADGDIGAFTVYRSDRPDANFASIGATGGATLYPFSDTLSASNTLTFYRYVSAFNFGAFADSSSNDMPIVSKTLGVSDGSVAGTGPGLYTAFNRGTNGGNATNLPVHVVNRGLAGWEKGTGNVPMVSAAESQDGSAIGPDNFEVSWSGWLEPPYTGYYWLRTQTDDGIGVWVGTNRVIHYWGYTGNALTSEPLWLEAGRRVPVHVDFQQGTGGGYFRMWWKHGLGQDGDFIGLPTAQFYPLAPTTAPKFVSPGGPDTFGAWKNIDINTACPGHVIVSGDPESFDCKITGGGGDIWGTSDGAHFLYQELEENFEIEATFSSLEQADGWSKVGLMVRDGTAANARNVCLVQSAGNGRRLQLRATAGGESASLAPAQDPNVYGTGPVTFRLVRDKGKIIAYINGSHVLYTGDIDIDVSGWSKNLCVGLAITAHNNSRLSDSLVTEVTFKINHAKGSVMFLK